MRAFLSHASEDKSGFVEPLARELAEMGVAPWLDVWEIRPGDSLVKKLFDEGLDTVDAVIVVVSASSAAKPWVREELDAAVVRRITSSTRLIPVRLDDAPVPAPIQHLIWISADRTPEGIRSAAEQITDALYARDKRPAVAPPPAYTTAAADSRPHPGRLRLARRPHRGGPGRRVPAGHMARQPGPRRRNAA